MSASPEYIRASPGLLQRPAAAAIPAALASSDEKECCRTPTSAAFRLPAVADSCPPAPRKPIRAIRCKRRLQSELEFVVIRHEEIEGLFKRRDHHPEADELVSLQISKKKRKLDS